MSIFDRPGEESAGTSAGGGNPGEEHSIDPDDLTDHLSAAGENARSVYADVLREQVSDAGDDADALYHAYKDWWEEQFATGHVNATAIADVVEERTVEVNEDIDEDAFFSTVEGHTTVANRYDLEKTVPLEKKSHFFERERYWVNKPYSYVVIFHSRKENETKYYLVEPYLTPIEEDLREFLTEKLRTAIKYESEDVLVEDGADKVAVIEREMRRLLDRYDLHSDGGSMAGFVDRLRSFRSNLGSPDDDTDEASSDSEKESSEEAADEGEPSDVDAPDDEETRDDAKDEDEEKGSLLERVGLGTLFGGSEDDEAVEEEETASEPSGPIEGIAARPEPALIEEDSQVLTEYQIEKILYNLKRDFVGFERIDGIKHDINVEDISCDGYNSPVFVYHSEYENIITNVYHGEEELDEFVVKMAQRSGKGISKRQPQVDATLPDGSRSQLTLGREVSDHGTNYTIRQFKDVPFTPVDLINWHTFSLDQMAFLWLAIENHKSLIFAGGTASGKTTSLNAVSLFIPSNAKIVSIEDTREVELPQRNWIASVTRPSFSDDDKGDIDEFDLLEAALRQRPDYIVMGEIRGEEGRTLFQVMSTGHTTYTTFHADSVGEVLKRFTTEPINVSKTLFTALDLVSIQTQTRVQGHKVRKSKSITEINEYNAEHDEINVRDVYQWRAEPDEFEQVGRSNVVDQIMFDRGWSRDELDDNLFKRRVVIAYIIRNQLNQYAQVAATLQAFMSDPDTIIGLIANDVLEESLSDLREMESVHIDIAPEKEALVPRPDPNDEVYELSGEILAEAEERIFDEYREIDATTDDFERALVDAASGGEIPVDGDPGGDLAESFFEEAETVDDDANGGVDGEANGGVGGEASGGIGDEANGGGDGGRGDVFFETGDDLDEDE